MASNIGKLSKASFKKESIYGTGVTPDKSLSVTAINLTNAVDTVKDPRFIGKIFTSDLIAVAQSPTGSLPLTVHPQEIGPVVDLTLMKTDAVANAPDAYLVVYYTGPNAYAEISMATTVLTVASGTAHGSTSPDVSLDGTTSPYNTVAKMAAAIIAGSSGHVQAYALGNQASLTTEIADFTYVSMGVANGVNGYILKAISAMPSTLSKLHVSRPALATDTELSSTVYTDITLGTGQALEYSGCKTETLALKITSKSLLTADWMLVAQKETTGGTYPTISFIEDHAFTAVNARYFFGGSEVTNAKDISLTIANALDKQHIVGSQYITEPIRGDASIQIAGTVNLNITDWTARYAPDYIANAPVEMLVYCQGTDYADAVNKITYNFLVRLPAVKLSKYETKASGPGRITTAIAGEAVAHATIDQIEWWTTDTQTSAY